NLIGTDRTGRERAGNGRNGVYVDGASENVIGTLDNGTCPAPCNVIADNREHGVRVSSFDAFASDGNKVRGNFIGTNAEGSGPPELGNTGSGVLLGAPSGTAGAAVTGTYVGGPRASGSEICDGPCNL